MEGGFAQLGGFDAARGEFARAIDAACAEGSEEMLTAIFGEVAGQAEIDLAELEVWDETSAHELVAAVEAWASVYSYGTSRFYFEGPNSIRKLGGFGGGVTSKLQDAARRFKPHLERALGALGASSFSISVGFPWGVSVGLSWP